MRELAEALREIMIDGLHGDGFDKTAAYCFYALFMCLVAIIGIAVAAFVMEP